MTPRSGTDAPHCSRCGRDRDRPGQRYCRSCAAAYKRERAKRSARAVHLCEKFNINLDAVQIVTRQQIDKDTK